MTASESTMIRGPIAVFALNSSWEFGEKVCARLGISLSAHEEREFEDGEHKARPLVNVRGKDVFVIQSLYGRICVDHLEARKLFVNHFMPLIGHRDVVVVSPDVGGVKRAEEFRQALSRAQAGSQTVR